MKNNVKRLLAILMSLLMVVGLCACGGGNDGNGDTPGGVDAADRDAKILAEPNTISFIVPGYDGTDTNSPYYKAIEELKTKYGKEVVVMQAVGDQTWNQKVAAQVAAKDPIDVFYISVDQYLNM